MLIMNILLQNLYNFLAQPNVLTHLNLTNTETTLENVSIICFFRQVLQLYFLMRLR